MSEIKVNSIKGVGASAAAITVNNTDGTCTANLTNRTNKNLVVNGACLVSQRGTSSTTNGYATVDRFKVSYSGTDEAPTQSQATISSGTTPYELGFRKSLKITNGNQTSGAGAADFITYAYRIEAQDMAGSGWNYKSTSSFISFSFYIKSSVAQSFGGFLRTHDGSQMTFPFETGSLSADTWTKITRVISGNGAIGFSDDTGTGLEIIIGAYWGTDYTSSGKTLDAWSSYSNDSRLKDFPASTWYTTNDATLEITGVQLEVGSVATDFEHRSFGQELALCQRYYQVLASTTNDLIGMGYGTASGYGYVGRPLLVEMRAVPSLDDKTSGSTRFRVNGNANSNTGNNASIDTAVSNNKILSIVFTGFSGLNDGSGCYVRKQGSSALIGVSSEL